MGYHLVIRGERGILRLPTSPKTIFMPSVNVIVESVLETFSGITIAEDESTAIVYGMPREAIERGRS